MDSIERATRLAPSGWARLAHMKRDMELVRDICRAVEAKANQALEPLEVPGADPDMLGAHLVAMIRAGLIDGRVSESLEPGPPRVAVSDFTWAGHNFSAGLLNETVWGQMKAKIGPAELAKIPLEILGKVAAAALEAWALGAMGLK